MSTKKLVANTTTSNELIHVEDLVVGYDRRPLLPKTSFHVEKGEVWGLIGANGSGKTTLLKTLLGLLPPVAGTVGQARELKVGYVPQRSAFDLSVPTRVIDLIRAGADREWSFLKPFFLGAQSDSVELAMKETDTTSLAREQFADLSEGQKQRVLIARALVSYPDLLVLDEPTSAMDVTAEQGVFELLARIVADRGLAVILVSHHLPVLGKFATHAVYVDRDEQVIVPGDIHDVCQCRECQVRYGDVLSVLHEHVHDHDHDHDHHHHHNDEEA